MKGTAPKPLYEAEPIDIHSLVKQYMRERYGFVRAAIAFYYGDKFRVKIFSTEADAKWHIENISPRFYMELYLNGEYADSNAEYWKRSNKEIPFDPEE